MRKRIISITMVMAIIMSMVLSACTQSSSQKGSESVPKTEKASEPAPKQEPKNKVKITYWHHDGAAKTNPIYEEMFEVFTKENADIDVEYLGLPADSFFQKYLTAVATNTGPDAYGMRDAELSAMVAQKALEPLDEHIRNWNGFKNIEPVLIQSARNMVPDKMLYLLPQYYNHDIMWYNLKEFQAKGITPPKNVTEFLEACKKHADPVGGKYFFTLRGNKGFNNTLTWLLNYTANVGEESGLFNKDGTSIFRNEKFINALDAYASIYWNNWISKDSVTANYKEMVAEFGAGTSMLIFHNSSSVVEHAKNLGEGNFMNAMPIASDIDGKVYIKSVGPIGASVSSQSKFKDAAFKLVAFLSDEYAVSYQSENIGKIPANKVVYEHEWFKKDPYMELYKKIMSADNVVYFEYPDYLPQWKEFQNILSDDLQAVMLKKATSKEVLEKWAKLTEGWYAEYKKANN